MELGLVRRECDAPYKSGRDPIAAGTSKRRLKIFAAFDQHS